MPTGHIDDPFMSYNFLLEIEGIITAAFQECGGIGSEMEVKEYNEGGNNGPARKLAGRPKFNNITLKRGVTYDRDLYDWHEQWLWGESGTRRSGSIILKNREGAEVVRWDFVEAWPVKWTGPTFNAESNEVAIEEIELANEGIVRVDL